MLATSLVRSIGAQNSPSGINSLPSDQLQPLAMEQSAASLEAMQEVHMESWVSLPTLTGWQNSVENNGVFPVDGSVGLTGGVVVESLPFLH
jgi:hypothetical protein